MHPVGKGKAKSSRYNCLENGPEWKKSITANRDDSIEITKIMRTKRRKEEVALIKLMHITSWGYGKK